MIIADKILKLRKENGWSQEELADKLNVSRQSVSKWESAQSIPDINRIMDLSNLFGVTIDYLLKDELEQENNVTTSEAVNVRRVSLDEALDYLASLKQYGRRVGIGVFLCILSPLFLIGIQMMVLTNNASELRIGALSGVGMVILLIMVAIAVGIFLMAGSNIRKYNYFEEEEFELEYGVRGIIQEAYDNFMPTYTRKLITGVMLCIVSVIPLIVGALMGLNDTRLFPLLAILFIIVACAVYLFITIVVTSETYERVLKIEDYDPRKVEENEQVEKFAGIYWPIVVAIYLGISFLTGYWHLTWIIWPVAGCLFAGLSGIFHGKKK